MTNYIAHCIMYAYTRYTHIHITHYTYTYVYVFCKYQVHTHNTLHIYICICILYIPGIHYTYYGQFHAKGPGTFQLCSDNMLSNRLWLY